MLIKLFNRFHLGDNVYQMYYNIKLIHLIDCEIEYYCESKYFTELYNMIPTSIINKIKLNDISHTPKDAVDTWIGRDNFYYDFIVQNKSYNEMYISFFYILSKMLNVENPIIQNYDLLSDDVRLLDNKFNIKCDLLLVNSIPNSNQINYNSREFNDFISVYKDKYNIVSTYNTSFSDVPCTLDFGMNLIDIGALSVSSKVIVGVHTSPIIYTYNRYNYNKNIKWCILQQYGITYTFNKNTSNTNTIKNVNI